MRHNPQYRPDIVTVLGSGSTYADAQATILGDQQDLQRFWNDSGADIAPGETVVIDLTDTTFGLGGSIKVAPAGGSLGDNAGLVRGVAVETIPDNADGLVCVGGLVYAEVAAGVAANEPMTTDGAGTAGHLEGGTWGAAYHIVGTSLEAIAATVAGVARIYLFPIK